MVSISANVMYYYSSKKCVIFVVVFFLTILVLSTRTYNQPDFYNYNIIYDFIFSRGDVLNYISSIEIGFLALLKLLSSFGLSYVQVSNVVFFLICASFGYAAHQHRDMRCGEAYLVFALLFSSYYFYFLSLNVIRQGLAVAMFTVGLSMLLSNRKRSILFFLIAILFHYSAALLFFVVVVSKYAKRKLSVIACFGLVTLSFFLGLFDILANFPFPDFFANRIEKLKYYSDSNVASYAKLVFYLVICVVYYSFIMLRKKFSRDVFFLSSAFLSLSFIFMYYGEFLDRLMMYSVAFSAFIAIDVYRMLNQKVIGNLLVFLYCSISYALVLLSPSLNGFFL